eukprot:TRINITY_DN40715_c0_g1_i1.p1 TRINITY_DN40715_c0_g1~~TRINITY_DN40715_c0_g1_i1.p1  ORF type:complete len:575 (+),score=190.37 TRINITY_DN40715_c0_g1_i1:72-1727(+)
MPPAADDVQFERRPSSHEVRFMTEAADPRRLPVREGAPAVPSPATVPPPAEERTEPAAAEAGAAPLPPPPLSGALPSPEERSLRSDDQCSADLQPRPSPGQRSLRSTRTQAQTSPSQRPLGDRSTPRSHDQPRAGPPPPWRGLDNRKLSDSKRRLHRPPTPDLSPGTAISGRAEPAAPRTPGRQSAAAEQQVRQLTEQLRAARDRADALEAQNRQLRAELTATKGSATTAARKAVMDADWVHSEKVTELATKHRQEVKELLRQIEELRSAAVPKQQSEQPPEPQPPEPQPSESLSEPQRQLSQRQLSHRQLRPQPSEVSEAAASSHAAAAPMPLSNADAEVNAVLAAAAASRGAAMDDAEMVAAVEWWLRRHQMVQPQAAEPQPEIAALAARVQELELALARQADSPPPPTRRRAQVSPPVPTSRGVSAADAPPYAPSPPRAASRIPPPDPPPRDVPGVRTFISIPAAPIAEPPSTPRQEEGPRAPSPGSGVVGGGRRNTPPGLRSTAACPQPRPVPPPGLQHANRSVRDSPANGVPCGSYHGRCPLLAPE